MTKLNFVKNEFKIYKKHLIWIDHHSKLEKMTKLEKNELEKWIKFNSYLETVLEYMDEYNSQVLKDIFLNNFDKEKFFCADSTFYFRRKKAIEEFMYFYCGEKSS